jgi:hypothetical protein
MPEEPRNEPFCAHSEPSAPDASNQPFDLADDERFLSLIARLAARQHIRLSADGVNSIQTAPAAKPYRSLKRGIGQIGASEETPGIDTS